MSFSTALTTLVGVLGLANLVLALGRTRRVAEPHQRVDDLGGAPPGHGLADAALADTVLADTALADQPPNPAVTVAPDPRS